MLPKSTIGFLIITFTLLVSLTVSAAVKDEIKARIAPVGEVCMAGDPCASAAVQVASGPRSGEEIYNSKCLACHTTGAAGAPKVGDVDQWLARLNKGIDTLYTNAIKGINGMPAKGLCMDCSDDEIKATVDYMLAESK